MWADADVRAAVGSIHMGIAADINATIDGWTREELDDYALRTHAKSTVARAAGAFDRALIPQPGADRGPGLDHDELVRPASPPRRWPGCALPSPISATRTRWWPRSAQSSARSTMCTPSAPHRRWPMRRRCCSSATRRRRTGSVWSRAPGSWRRRQRLMTRVIMLTAGQRAARGRHRRGEAEPGRRGRVRVRGGLAALCLRFSRDLRVGDDRLNPNGGTMASGMPSVPPARSWSAAAWTSCTGAVAVMASPP